MEILNSFSCLWCPYNFWRLEFTNWRLIFLIYSLKGNFHFSFSFSGSDDPNSIVVKVKETWPRRKLCFVKGISGHFFSLFHQYYDSFLAWIMFFLQIYQMFCTRFMKLFWPSQLNFMKFMRQLRWECCTCHGQDESMNSFYLTTPLAGLMHKWRYLTEYLCKL